MRFSIGQGMTGNATGQHVIDRLVCETCGDVQEAMATDPKVDPDGVTSVRTACPRCNGTVQVYLRKVVAPETRKDT